MLKTPGERVKYTALLRAMINFGRKEATDLLNSSKQNLARELYAVRTKNSLRCPIVPSTTLPIDQVQIPRHLAYEICRSGFIKFLMEQYNFTEEQAKFSTKEESTNLDLQRAFDEYVNGNPSKGIPQQCVIINRPPSLHELNISSYM
jgi:DNA-directed RNA polymerase beta' subunit